MDWRIWKHPERVMILYNYAMIADGAYEQYTILLSSTEKVFASARTRRSEDVKWLMSTSTPSHTLTGSWPSFRYPTGKTRPEHIGNILKSWKTHYWTCQDLPGWARQSVLLLNRSLTVEEGKPNGMTDSCGYPLRVICWVNSTPRLPQPIIFVLWGKERQELEKIVDGRKPCLESRKTCPFSAYRGFFGTKPFKSISI